MKSIGKWLTRVDTPEGSSYFEKLYGRSYWQHIVESELFHITRIFPKDKLYIIFLESDGNINQLLALEEKDHIMVYSDGCLSEEGAVFNTDGMAFIRLVRDCKVQATLIVENSPYDINVDEGDLENYEITEDDLFININNLLTQYEILIPADSDNTILVGQL